jgi:hypothetical protein
LRLALWAVALASSWPVSPSAAPDALRPAGPSEPAPFNGAPPIIPAPDRSAIEEELSAVMTMTPPDRSVTAELPSGSRLSIRPGAYGPGPSGLDCRPFEYAYEAVGGGAAMVTGVRCKAAAALTWLPVSPDTLVQWSGLPPPPSASSDPHNRLPSPVTPDRPRPATSPRPEPVPQSTPPAPPSRVILPFTPAR